MRRLILLSLVALAGFWLGMSGQTPGGQKNSGPVTLASSEKEFPVIEHKSFVIVIYAYNQDQWCQRALRSVFEQDYDHYRLIVINDASIDQTEARAKQFILDNSQDGKVIFITNETHIGPVASLYRVIDSCLDREIVIPLLAKDWLSSDMVLNKLNIAYQNPDVWLSSGQSIDYPSYAIRDDGQISYYAALFKEIPLKDLFIRGKFASHPETYLAPLRQISSGKIRKLKEPLSFCNLAPAVREGLVPLEVPSHEPLSSFPSPRIVKKADILVFSCDRPLQLYACLESIQRYVGNFENLTVLYRASKETFSAGYEKVKDAFPLAHFVSQTSNDFKAKLEKIVFDSPSEYILFGTDDLIAKDFVDLRACTEQMEKTGAYGFYLRFGRHISQSYLSDQPQPLPPSHPISGGIYAWEIDMGESDWGFAPSLDMTLFRKDRIKKILTQSKYKNPNGLEFSWLKEVPEKAIGLYFERSKLVNIPMNAVGPGEKPHMNYLNTEELLAKFNQGLKIDIEPLYKVENSSPHLDYIPEFVIR